MGCGSRGSQVICDEPVWDKPYFFSSLRINFSAAAVFRWSGPRLQNLSFAINGAPQINQAFINLEIDFVLMPCCVRLRPPFTQVVPIAAALNERYPRATNFHLATAASMAAKARARIGGSFVERRRNKSGAKPRTVHRLQKRDGVPKSFCKLRFLAPNRFGQVSIPALWARISLRRPVFRSWPIGTRSWLRTGGSRGERQQ
jgi:hypothetical protein